MIIIMIRTILERGSDSRQGRNSSSKISMGSLALQSEKQLKASLSNSTWNSYNRAVSGFIKFRNDWNLGSNWPVQASVTISYISFLSLAAWAPSSIFSHLSAISFVHKNNGWSDPTDSFVVKKLKEGCRRLYSHPTKDVPSHFKF